MNRFSLFLANIKKLAGVYVAGLVLLFAIRLFFMTRIFSWQEAGQFKSEIISAFVVGWRFDTMVLMYGLAIPLLLCLIALLFHSEKYHILINIFNMQYSKFMLFVFTFIGIVDVYYFNYFQSHINVLAFGLFEDDTAAVLKSVWTDYPVVKVLIALLIASFLIHRTVRRIFRNMHTDSSKKIPLAPLWSVIALGAFFLGMRGSVGTFPLQIDDSTVCDNSNVNLLPINGVFAIKEAFLMRSRQMSIDGNIAFLKNIGFGNVQSAVTTYFGKPATADPFEIYFDTTATDTATRPLPNVVFFLMESMSNNNLYYHSPTLNLYGALEKHLGKDIFLRNFLSSGNGTINSLEGIMVNTPITSLAQSEYNGIAYSSSVALPFLNAGYETTFITGGKFGWRNINEFIPHQYFQHVESKDNVMKEIPGATECEWGVYDQYLFDYVFKKLKEAKRPQMIFVLTTTNHTPFHLPDNYKPYPIKLTAEIRSKLLTDETMAVKNLTNLQYSNDCLGHFMDEIKASPLGNNTLVAATGDHNNLMLFDFSDKQLFFHRSVPFYCYIPDAYKPHVQLHEWGSHKDIFPTLINLSLPGSRYFNSGDNLFDTTSTPSNIFATDWMSMEAMNSSGAVKFGTEEKYFEWKENHLLAPTTTPSEDLKKLMTRARAHYAAMAYFIKNETVKPHKN